MGGQLAAGHLPRQKSQHDQEKGRGVECDEVQTAPAGYPDRRAEPNGSSCGKKVVE